MVISRHAFEELISTMYCSKSSMYSQQGQQLLQKISTMYCSKSSMYKVNKGNNSYKNGLIKLLKRYANIHPEINYEEFPFKM